MEQSQSLHRKIEIYTAMPYAGEDGKSLDEWFHVARNEKNNHIETVWDLEKAFRPEFTEERPPIFQFTNYFDRIRLHYALDYTSSRHHEDLLMWAHEALISGGRLDIITRNGDWILNYWLADALALNIDDFLVRQPKTWWVFIRNFLLNHKESHNPDRHSLMLKQVGIPESHFKKLRRDEIALSIPDRIAKDRPPDDWEFDLWLNQQLYSSGAGEPQDSFKSICTTRYLSILMRKTRFVVNSLHVNSQNPFQLEVQALKHPSRLV